MPRRRCAAVRGTHLGVVADAGCRRPRDPVVPLSILEMPRRPVRAAGEPRRTPIWCCWRRWHSTEDPRHVRSARGTLRAARPLVALTGDGVQLHLGASGATGVLRERAGLGLRDRGLRGAVVLLRPALRGGRHRVRPVGLAVAGVGVDGIGRPVEGDDRDGAAVGQGVGRRSPLTGATAAKTPRGVAGELAGHASAARRIRWRIPGDGSMQYRCSSSPTRRVRNVTSSAAPAGTTPPRRGGRQARSSRSRSRRG